MTFTEFLIDLSHGDEWSREIARLERLAGHQLCETYWIDSIRASRGQLEPWMPLWFVPIARLELDRIAGVDLRPGHVADGAFRVMETWGPGLMITSALTLEEYVVLRIARTQIIERNAAESMAPPGEVLEARQIAESALGLSLPAIDVIAEVEELRPWLWEKGYRAPFIAMGARGGGRPVEEELRYTEAALEFSPDCLQLRFDAGFFYVELGDIEEAVSHIVRGLLCPRYTRYQTTPEHIVESGRNFYDLYPEAFPPEVITRLNETDPAKLGPLIDSARVEKRFDDAVRLAIDLGYEQGEIEPTIEPLLRPLFNRLDWNWALSLCDYRQGKID